MLNELPALEHPEEHRSVEAVYLRPDVKIEPLLCGWYAWPHLIAPAQLALNLVGRYIPMLQSFIANPRVHAAASRNPELLCGPYLPYAEEHLPAVRELLGKLTADCAELIRFAAAFRSLDLRLQEAATGHSIAQHYPDAATELSGLIELVYDLNHHPRIRLFEEMLYASQLNTRVHQQICVSLVAEQERGFFLNTPRMRSAKQRVLQTCFDDSRIDSLVSMRTRPRDYVSVLRELEVPQGDRAHWNGFFTALEPARREVNHTGAGVRMRYFGHACVLLQSSRTSVLLDPMTAHDEAGDGRFTMADLPDRIDYVVITHGHQDHCSPEILLQLRSRVGTIVVPRNLGGNLADPSLKLMLKALGYRNIIEADPLDEVFFDGGSIMSVPFFGEHADLDIHAKQCALVRLDAQATLFCADSNCLDDGFFKRVKPLIGKVDTLFIGMECHGAPLTWLYGPYLTRPLSRRDDNSRRLSGSDSERAWRTAQMVGCRRAFVYAMGMEPWMRHLMGLAYTPESIQIVEVQRFLSRCRDKGIPAALLNGCREEIL